MDKGPMSASPWGPSNFTALVAALGQPAFPRLLLEALNEQLDVRHFNVVGFDNALRGHLVLGESLGPNNLPAAAGRIYETSLLHRHDPSVTVLPGKARASPPPALFRLRAEEIRDSAYRTELFDRFGLVERLSMIGHFAGRWNVISIYRDTAGGVFGDAAIACAEALAAPVVALVAKHLEFLPLPRWQCDTPLPVALLERNMRALDGRLTPRQVQVCARALAGMTNAAIGLDLGIRVPTVATLRMRAYNVLNISSLNELFALCLTRLPPQ